MGGGRRYFLPNTTVDPETNTTDKNQRQDGHDLIQVYFDEEMSRSTAFPT